MSSAKTAEQTRRQIILSVAAMVSEKKNEPEKVTIDRETFTYEHGELVHFQFRLGPLGGFL